MQFISNLFHTNFKRSVEDKNNNPSSLSEAKERYHQMSDSEKCEIKTPPPQEMDCSEPDMKTEISAASDGENEWIFVSENSTNVNSSSHTNSSAKEEAVKNRLKNEKSSVHRNFSSTKSANQSQAVSPPTMSTFTEEYGSKKEHGARNEAARPPWK